MPKFAANLTMLFNELPFLDRFAAAAAARFEAVEFLFPYEHSIEALRDRLSTNELSLVLHNLPAGNWAAGERGIACLPDRVEEFREGVALGVRYATALGCKQVNCLAGIPTSSTDPQVVRETFVSNLRFAAEAFAEVGLTLLTEPINTRDVPGFYLNSTRQALELIDAVGAANLKLQYDVYHMQIMEGDLSQTIKSLLARIGHMQIADTPGRNEPGSGEINYEFLLRFIDSVGYDGWIGCEYRPKTQTIAGLSWMRSIAGVRS